MALGHRCGAWIVLALLLAPGSAAAESEVFMCIPDIPGSSADEQFRGCSSIFGVAHSVEAPFNPSGAPGRPSCNPYEVGKAIDESSGPILNRILRGRTIDEVEFAIRRTRESPLVVFELVLTDVAILEVEQDFAATADFPVEQIALRPRTVQWRFTSQNADGSAGDPVEFSLSCF